MDTRTRVVRGVVPASLLPRDIRQNKVAPARFGRRVTETSVGRASTAWGAGLVLQL
jgi:hypothetical protein